MKRFEPFLDATPIPTATGVSFQQGLVWETRGTGADAIVEHAGIDPGTTTLASVKPKKGIAALVFANVTGHKELGRFMREAIAQTFAADFAAEMSIRSN